MPPSFEVNLQRAGECFLKNTDSEILQGLTSMLANRLAQLGSDEGYCIKNIDEEMDQGSYEVSLDKGEY